MQQVDISQYPTIVGYISSNQGWLCIYPDLKGCAAGGATEEAAKAAGAVAAEKWMKRAGELSIPIPVPGSETKPPQFLQFSLPPSLQSRIRARAKETHTTPQEIVTTMLYGGVHYLKEKGSIEPDDLTWHQCISGSQHNELKGLAEKHDVPLNLLVPYLITYALDRSEDS